jgi:predicted SnoaL-like aldol condensation-catalyzing enzyme
MAMSTTSVERNRETIRRLFDAFRAADVDAFDDLLVEDYVQHNPQAGSGREAAKAFFAQLGRVDVDVHRMVIEADLAAIHSHYKTLGMAGADFFRFNGEGKIIEHWDVLQQVPDTTVSGNDMFSQLT